MILNTNRARLLVAAFFALFVSFLAVACGGDGDDPGVGEVITPGGITIATAEINPSPYSPNGDPNLRGFVFPIAGGCLPKGDQLMPNAPRTYRDGIHEGVDFYNVDNCVPITKGTPVLAAKAGTVIRADLGYVNPTSQQMSLYLANPTTEASFDAFRGRQVWIRHDDGSFYVTRYCHLDGIAPGISVGTRVTAGQTIAYVGESGTPESLTNPGAEYHLHFEMRVGGSYLGAGQPAATVRQLYTTFFSP